MNEASSRSHAILVVYAVGTNLSTGVQTVGKLNLIDLAGSERVSKYGTFARRYLTEYKRRYLFPYHISVYIQWETLLDLEGLLPMICMASFFFLKCAKIALVKQKSSGLGKHIKVIL